MVAKSWLVLLLALLATVCLDTSVADTVKCPQDCKCEANSTIRCTHVAGLRSLDKSQPIARLDLSGLELTKVPGVLENVRNITELDLSRNRLAEVNHLGKRIRKLDLSHNRITSAKLARLPPFVESLNLTFNDLTYLPLNLMKLKRLRYIELANNPINCTCETLHIRNWLTSRHVWSDEHVKCMAPAEFKGQPWLQVRQLDVCNPSVVEERKEGYRWDDYEDENELMLGDAPQPEANEEDEDDFKREYFPVGEKVKRNEPPIVVNNSEDEEASGEGPAIGADSSIGEDERRKVFDGPVDEGSGEPDESPRVIDDVVDDGEAEEDQTDDGSGSGGGLLLMNIGAIDIDHVSSTTVSTIEPDHSSVEEEPEESPMEFPSLHEDLGIFREEDEEQTSLGTTSDETTSEATNARVMIGAAGVMKTASDAGGSGGSSETPLVEDDAAVATQSEEDNQKTYLLLAILGIILVALIIMVVCKRKPDSRNRRGKYDVETANGQGREMKEMNKNLLEKGPADRNGHGAGSPATPEQTPLMSPDKTDYERVFGDPQKTAFSPVKPVRTSLEKPMESFKPIAAERRTNDPAQHGAPVADNNNTTSLPNGNGALHNGDASPAGVHKPPNHVPSANGDVTDPDGHLAVPMESPRSKRYSPIYVPTSPKSDRYSPVYSPETGRVKIKLTETPKPKTPILVTRSRSRAGDIITTMDDQKF
ncbi:protein windpipe [Anopheles stephensi]|uniref:protein windpipe n=1 Tax=Anopheles stephensi TaxID=30069 RepID=UPI001658752B|nr:protein windpipe [Anopheles stephensi]XP_035917023.1 protein windpipe [Anopheles stephensi]XP_035917024.1 protein windpipe [Anopheles stephensi]XP_035917025.1 protein windpipe [Anopheles stephensi]XP_035917026.1 protein windpipe [Anopheles stephensi]XP_035917027.1 protein windpipe [Anopheles stephensi]XP_035917028.1 protein windpipe [Anopheles stephensi]XP_035917029.1 protein windpipe [Anopheles stephensi]XP_035917030.1 protein windpipe [Anopheles stephensi]